MKKIMVLLVAAGILLTSGCQKASDIIIPRNTETPQAATPTPTMEPVTQNPQDQENEVQTKIPFKQTLEMTNEWTILGDYNFEITKKGVKDRIILGTSAKNENGEMMWDDSQYWTAAVICDHNQDGRIDGAYNLFSERMQGNIYMEVNEGFVSGFTTPVVTLYVFSGNDRQIINYIFDGENFVKNIEYTTKNYSTGGINNMYGTMPEYKPL